MFAFVTCQGQRLGVSNAFRTVEDSDKTLIKTFKRLTRDTLSYKDNVSTCDYVFLVPDQDFERQGTCRVTIYKITARLLLRLFSILHLVLDGNFWAENNGAETKAAFGRSCQRVHNDLFGSNSQKEKKTLQNVDMTAVETTRTARSVCPTK